MPSRSALRNSTTTRLPPGGVGFAAAIVFACALTSPDAVAGQDGEVQWRNTTEFSYLVSGGNSISSTLGLRNTFRRTAENGQLRLDLSTIRTDATRIHRRAVGTPSDYRVAEEEETVRTAERYSTQARYDRTLTPRVFAYGSAGWERNEFAGFTSRTVLSSGAGAQWVDREAWNLKLAVGLTYTVREDVTPDPDRDRSFAGLRATIDHVRDLTTGTGLEVAWVIDANAQDWGDVRGDLKQAVSASLTDRLSLKTTLQLLLENEPPVESLPLFTPAGEPTGQTVLSPLGRMDRTLSVALVVTL